jgi:hypothetical protein
MVYNMKVYNIYKYHIFSKKSEKVKTFTDRIEAIKSLEYRINTSQAQKRYYIKYTIKEEEATTCK